MVHPAQPFRACLYRPDIIQRLLAEGSVERAREEADKERNQTSPQVKIEDVLPPQVEITSPKHGAQLMKPEVIVEATAKGDARHPVREMKLLLDGRSYEGTRGVKNIQRVGPKA